MVSNNIKHCVKILQRAYPKIKKDFENKFPGWRMALSCTHRPPEEQWELYKKGREYNHKTKRWIISDARRIVTKIDGKTKTGKHNYYPSQALDVALQDPQKDWFWPKNPGQTKQWAFVASLAKKYNLVNLGAKYGWDYAHFETITK